MRILALPVASLADAKSRLSPVLTPIERAALTLAMLEDVLDVTLALTGWQTWVISPDEAVLEIALRRQAEAVLEEEPGLAGSIAQMEETAEGRGADALAILLPDTPLITVRGLTKALRTLGGVVIAPNLGETGTNLLMRRPPRAIAAHFGRDSYRRHLQEAAEHDLPASVITSAELGFDLDVPGDILTLLNSDQRGRTMEICRELELEERLASAGVGLHARGPGGSRLGRSS